MFRLIVCVVLISLISRCGRKTNQENSYEYHLHQINQRIELIELATDDGEARLIVAPSYQGRIITSTNKGLSGNPLGWFNVDAFQSDQVLNGSEIHGEERIWIGPLGSQFSFFYGRKKPLDGENWDVPKTFNSEPFSVVSQNKRKIVLEKDIQLVNFLGTTLNMYLQREIQLYGNEEINQLLGIDVPQGVAIVGYQTRHVLTNTDSTHWKKETGLATIWSLSSFPGTDSTMTIIPITGNCSTNEILKYLGAPGQGRLSCNDQTIRFKTDGQYRSKIGIPRAMSKGVYGSYQPETSTLRIIQFQQTNDSLYFNSDASVQEHPYRGEVIPIYNHGPMDLSISKENSFFEMESTAALKELAPGESLTHAHRVFQFTGNKDKLKEIIKIVVNVDL